MGLDIYYFSGTGNSYIVARDIASELNGKLIPISSFRNKEIVSPDADGIGIVFPVYYGDLPVIIKDFAAKLSKIDSLYFFAICTYGGAVGEAFVSLDRIIQSRGGKLSASYGVHMPQNAFNKPFENRKAIYENWKKKLAVIVKRTNLRRKGALISDSLRNTLLSPIYKMLKPLTLKFLADQSKSPINTPIENLIHLAGKSFKTNSQCNGCGICSQVCPAGNIKMIDRKPVWQNHCENCLACYNWCPQKAIQGWFSGQEYYYMHPGVKLSDMIAQKGE